AGPLDHLPVGPIFPLLPDRDEESLPGKNFAPRYLERNSQVLEKMLTASLIQILDSCQMDKQRDTAARLPVHSRRRSKPADKTGWQLAGRKPPTGIGTGPEQPRVDTSSWRARK